MYSHLEVHSMAIEADRRSLSARAERGWIIAQAATSRGSLLAAVQRTTGTALVRVGEWLQGVGIAEAPAPVGPAVAKRPGAAAL